MRPISFEWDPKKNVANQRKHGVTFEEALTVFHDENAVQFWDESHSGEEDRFLMLGTSYKLRVLLVVHCHKETDDTIRIISARKATKNEKKEYTRA